MKAALQLAIKRYIEGSKDSHGNATESWGDPEPWMVYGIAPGAMEEERSTGRDASRIALTVLAPRGGAPGSRDIVVVNGEEFEVDGRPDDWTQSPFPIPDWFGVTVPLTKGEG